MAAITLSASPVGAGFRETVTSSATTTRWLAVPQWAKYALVFLQPTTVTTSITPSFLVVDPVSQDDANSADFPEHAAFTAITATTGSYVFQFGPGVTGIADDIVNSATADSYASMNVVLPPILGIRTVCSGSCTYNLTVQFRS